MLELKVLITCFRAQIRYNVKILYRRNSLMFTHVSDADKTTSWLDHVLCSQDMQTKIHSIAILDMLPSSDHVPLSFVFDFNFSPTFNDTFTCLSNTTNFNWAIA